MDTPPPVLDSARLIEYAYVPEHITFSGRDTLIVGGKVIGSVPCLAICENLRKKGDFLLFHCNVDWEVLGVVAKETVKAAKKSAERNYPGIESCWQHVNVSREKALRYYDEEMDHQMCSFCGKRPFEIEEYLIQGKNAFICGECIKSLHASIHEDADQK